MLDRVATQIEKETQLKRRVKSAMVYPIVVMTFATLVLIFMLMFIVPVFQKVFDELAASCRRRRRSSIGDVERAARLLVHHLPGDRRRRSSGCGG